MLQYATNKYKTKSVYKKCNFKNKIKHKRSKRILIYTGMTGDEMFIKTMKYLKWS